MARVLCGLPHASGCINGIAFAAAPEGMLSEVVSDEAAAGFADIPGFTILGDGPPAPPAPASPPASAEAEGGQTAAQQSPRQTRRRA
jgi:hypothetical protein